MITFLSYRRDDSGGWARRLMDALRRRGEKVFIDVDAIKNFHDFEEEILASIDRSDIFLAVIGPHWLTLRDAQSGQRRIDQADDYVRVEIRYALQNRIPVLPVLVDNAALPTPDSLPEDIRDLVRPRFQVLSPEKWDDDLAEFLRTINPGKPLWSRRGLIAAAVIFTSGTFVGWLGPRAVQWVSSQLGIGDSSLSDRYYGQDYNGYGNGYGYHGAVGERLL